MPLSSESSESTITPCRSPAAGLSANGEAGCDAGMAAGVVVGWVAGADCCNNQSIVASAGWVDCASRMNKIAKPVIVDDDTPVPDPSHPLILPIDARRFAVGLSGGADSTYLSILASQTPGVEIILVHINHELRGAESDADEAFCRDLALRIDRPLIVARLSQIEPSIPDLPANPSARYRAIRLHVFKKAIDAHHLDALLLAHHADDQAETLLLRLARGGGIASLRGMQTRTIVQGMTILRPLLNASASEIRSRLRAMNQPWREDSSNASVDYRRNIARAILRGDPALKELLRDLALRARETIDRLDALAPRLADRFACGELYDLPAPVARHAARRWLIRQGAPADDVSLEVCDRLIEQATDLTAAPRRHYPGKLLIRRRKKHIERM
jgi:tRNA(Ile)-lysidine synthase